MKSLLLVRHAKSSWDFDLEDFDRPLNQRGLNDAPAMAKTLLKSGVKIDGFVSSPAKRALTTATFFAEAYDKKQKDIITIPSLYEPSVQAFYSAITSFDDNYETIAVFSHNPEITNFANRLTSYSIDEMPTCAILGLKVDSEKWSEFSSAKKDFWFFDYPKAK